MIRKINALGHNIFQICRLIIYIPFVRAYHVEGERDGYIGDAKRLLFRYSGEHTLMYDDDVHFRR